MNVSLKSLKEEIDTALITLLDESTRHNQTVHGYIANYYCTLLLFKEQNESNKKMLFWNRLLALATWGLAIVTFFLIYCK